MSPGAIRCHLGAMRRPRAREGPQPSLQKAPGRTAGEGGAEGAETWREEPGEREP